MVDVQLARQLTDQVSRLRQRQTAPLILELDLTDGIAEGPVADPLSALMSRRKLRLSDVLEGLRRARQDDRVRALVVKVGGSRIGLARIQELREAIGAFRETGKLTVAWSESFGEFTGGSVPYYLATAFDRIYLQPSGTLGLTGVAVEQIFLHDALAKLGVSFQSAKRHEYKSAADNLTERGFTEPNREANERLAVSIAEQITSSTAGRSWPKMPWPRAWSTRSATGTRSTRRCARRRALTPSCSSSRATSGRTR
jgi:protease-4